MSLGIHRLWKKRFVDWMNPSLNSKLIDVASGTGDIARLFSTKINNSSEITCIEPNTGMLEEGRKNSTKFKNIKWIKAQAEKLPVKDNIFDFYSISYGIRNVTDINKTLKEAYRVLKKGGKFYCLEFSQINGRVLRKLFHMYSKIIPMYGKLILGESHLLNGNKILGTKLIAKRFEMSSV
mgnify:CR=1 FL=1